MPESPQVIARLGLGLIVLCMAAACTRSMFVTPSGPGTPAPEAASAWADATRACRDARAMTAGLRISGKVGGTRLWPVNIEAAVTRDQSIYLSATAAGTSVFVLAGTANRATLWLRREQRVVSAAPAEIMSAIVGVPLSPDLLLAVLTGCGTRSFDVVRATRVGKLIAVETADMTVYLDQQGSAWRTRAAQSSAFVVEFGRTAGAVPAEVWIWSAPGREPAASIHVAVSDDTIDGNIPSSFFQIPSGAASATPITLDELRGVLWKTDPLALER